MIVVNKLKLDKKVRKELQEKADSLTQELLKTLKPGDAKFRLHVGQKGQLVPVFPQVWNDEKRKFVFDIVPEPQKETVENGATE